MATQVNYNGHLNSNEIFSAIYNMIISQQVFADNIKGTYDSLANKFKVDGSLYGDTKLFYSTDVLKSVPWGNDAEAANLLALDRPEAPECQSISIDQFRQIRLTVDEYLSKRAWGTEGAFSSFNSVMLGWIGDTKKVYESTLINAFVGTVVSQAARATIEVPLSDIPEGTGAEEKNRLEAEMIAQTIADLMVEMKDVSRDFTDYGNLRSYDESDLMVVWNSKYVNKIRKVDLPTIFHKDGLVDKFAEEILPARYFGQINAAAGQTQSTNTNVRSMVEKTYGTGSAAKHCFPGDLLPGSTAYLAGETYTEDADVICKVIHKDAIPFMSAFSTATSFFNPRSLTENHYLTFGFSTPEYLRDKPVITVEAD